MPETKDGHTDIVWSRVDAVAQLILENYRYMESKRNKELTGMVMKQFSVSMRQAQRYVSLAKAQVRKIGKERKETAFQRAVRDREYLLQQIRKSGCSVRDFRVELEVMKDRDKLYGLYEDKLMLSGEMKITFVENIED